MMPRARGERTTLCGSLASNGNQMTLSRFAGALPSRAPLAAEEQILVGHVPGRVAFGQRVTSGDDGYD